MTREEQRRVLEAYVGKLLEYLDPRTGAWTRGFGYEVKEGEEAGPSLRVFNFSTQEFEPVSDLARLQPYVGIIHAHPPSESIPLGLGTLRKEDE